MQVAVGGYRYAVKVSPRVPNGNVGFCVWATKEILISPSIPPEARLEALGHEYKEAYLFHYPDADDKEKGCDLFAALFSQLYDSLASSGGLLALQRLLPEKYVEPPKAEPAPEADENLTYEPDPTAPPAGIDDAEITQVDGPKSKKADASTWRADPGRTPSRMIDVRCCPGCRRGVAVGQIVDERHQDPYWGPVLFRTIHCHCLPGLWHWFEPAGPGWKPLPVSGSLEPEPRKTTNPIKVAAWLTDHPLIKLDEGN